MPADRALVLRRFAYSESSLVAHVLTREHGRVHLLARGAYRMQSRFFGVLDLFDELELEWSQSPRRELAELRRGDVARRRKPLREDLARYRAGTAMLELADVGSRPGRPDPELYELLSAGLDRLAGADRAPDAALVVFQLAFLQNHGLAPAFARCAACDREAPPTAEDRARAWFSAGSGGRLCAACAEDARAGGRRVGTMPVRVLDDAAAIAAPLREGPRRSGARRGARADTVRDAVRDAAESVSPLPPDPALSAERLLALRDLSERFLDYHLDSSLKASRRFLAAPNRNARRATS